MESGYKGRLDRACDTIRNKHYGCESAAGGGSSQRESSPESSQRKLKS